MSGHPRAKWKEAAESYPCEDCGAPPGQPCITDGGQPAHTPHVWRTNLASDNLWRPANAYEGDHDAPADPDR